MELTQIIVQAFLHGIAEIFPISPSGHDVLVDWASDWSTPSPLFGIAVRTGALIAIMGYFWQDVLDMATGVARALKGKRDSGATLAAQVLVATIPAVATGFLFAYYVQIDRSSLLIIGWTTVAGGLLLLAFDHLSMTVKRVEHASYLDSILIGLMQAAVFIPGAGRVAMTVTMARFLGYERSASARISMLLAIPALIVLNVRDAFELAGQQAIQIANADVIGAVVGLVGGLLALAVMMAWLRRASFLPFAVYRLALGAGILVLAYGWRPF